MNLNCLFGRHKYKVIRKINWSIQELQCVRCRKQIGINHEMKVVLPLDEELIHCHNIMLGKDN
jgi:hypothetical protein